MKEPSIEVLDLSKIKFKLNYLKFLVQFFQKIYHIEEMKKNEFRINWNFETLF